MLKKMIANVIMDQVTKGLESKEKSVITDFLKNVNKEDITSKVSDMFTKNPEGTKKPDVSDIVSVFENFFKEKPKTEPVPDNEESLSDDAKSFIDTFTSEINSFWKTFREIDNADTAIDTLESKIEEIDTLLYSYMSKGSIDGFDKIKMSMYSAVLEQLCSMLNIENDMKENNSNRDDNVTENTSDTEVEEDKVYNDLHKFEKTFKKLNPIISNPIDKEELGQEESIVEPVETGLDRLLGTIEKANRIQKALQESNINNIANGVSKTIENNTFGNRINVNASNISVEEYFNTDPTIRIVDLNNEDHILDLLENSKLNTGNIKELYMLNKSKMLFDFNTNTILMTDLADFG